MAEVFFDGVRPEGDEHWGLDGWTSLHGFSMIVTGSKGGHKAYLNYEQCSMLAAALIEHMKEVHDASKENTLKM